MSVPAIRPKKWQEAASALALLLTAAQTAAEPPPLPDGPIVPDGFHVELVAREPLVSNPTCMTFDKRGRLFIGQGPQWRAPTPDTPGDHVDILIDDDGDGIADRTKRFAEGFNSVQGIVWWGDALYIANSPDFTRVRDLDGDDVADEYVRLYTGLGNLEHSLHGLNIGPDGRLYMSKGNSKGYNRIDQLAPKPFRKLWGCPDPKGAPDHPPAVKFTKETYEKKYHTPPDDWGREGGILRCDRDGTNLEIVARGFRNPWDIVFDSGFNWLGTDNDQTQGDKIFAPFFGAHFGWGHAWSAHWAGEGHLPTVPASAPLFEGSGAGVTWYQSEQFPEEYRNTFLINDWMRREIYVFKPEWNGALMKCVGGKPGVLAHAGGGRSLPASQGRAFDPTDIEVAPDGSVYVASWGRGYGGTIKDGRQIDEGRIYRISCPSEGQAPASPTSTTTAKNGTPGARPSRSLSLPVWIAALGSHMSHVRADAQAALLERADEARPALLAALNNPDITRSHETWVLWTLARIHPNDSSLDDILRTTLNQDSPDSLERKIQTVRVIAHRHRKQGGASFMNSRLLAVLSSSSPRLRHAAVQAFWQSRQTSALPHLINRAAVETDRVTYHTLWKAIRDLAPESNRRALLKDNRPGVRLAALLGLLEDGLATPAEVGSFQDDDDPRIAALATSWLVKTGLIQPETAGREKPEPISYIPRAFVSSLRSHSRRRYTFDPIGLAVGKPYYTDRDYRITELPDKLVGLPYILPANNDDRLLTPTVFSFQTDTPVTLYLGTDTRNNAPLAWMKIGQPGGFESTDLHIKTQDATYQLHKKEYPAGTISLGPNLNHPRDSGRGHYLIVLDRAILSPPAKPTTIETALKAMPKSDAERGRDLFHHAKGAGCFNCHQLEKHGNVFAPDLSDIGARADARTLIESILEPSKVVTEGFAAQVFETKEDFTYSGIVIEESGASVKLAQATGQTVSIPKFKIRSRKATALSAMPAGFEHTMNPQQIADLTAYLLAQKKKAEPAKAKKPFTAKFTERADGFTFDETKNELRIFLGRQRIATYLKDHNKLTRRAFVNVTTPGGIQVTRNWPARKPDDLDPGYRGEDGIIHPIMHPGLWMGFGWIDGNDYWRLKARVVHEEWIEEPTGTKDEATFTARNRYLSEDGQRTVCLESCRIKLTRRPEGVLLDWDSSFKSDERDFVFGDQEESGLAIRVASPIRVQGGNGIITNDRGETNGSGTWGKPMKWIDYSGTINGKRVGLLVMPHPDNPRPSWSHSRDYGVMVSNPFPKQPRERRQPYVTTPVKKGETFRLRYGVLVYEAGAGLNVSAISEDLLARR